MIPADVSLCRVSNTEKMRFYLENFDQVPQTMNFSAWLHTKPDDVQDRFLGELRGRLFRRRNLNLIDFVDCSTWTLLPQRTLLERYEP